MEPTGWPSIKTTYSTFRSKLEEHAPTKEHKLEAVDYWIARLNQDKTTISLGEPFVPYP